MRTMVGDLAGTVAGFVTVLGLVAPAHALVIKHARLSDGNVSVSGNKAAKQADIYWLDDPADPVATSNRGGTFHFRTAIVPADCIARVNDAGQTPEATAPIRGCTPDGGTSSFPATGQTGCWDSVGTAISCADTGQDGDIRAGAELSYTSNADGTITDNNTGLVWEKKANCTGATHCVNDVYTWQQALDYAAALATSCFAGYCDWRLPNIKELQSIVNYQNVNPSVSPEFNDCANGSCTCSPCNVGADGLYWSSTSVATSASNAWDVIFHFGYVNANLKSSALQVRAVRGGL